MNRMKHAFPRRAAALALLLFAELFDDVATNVGGTGYWLSSVAAGLPAGGNNDAVTVADFAALVEPGVRRV